MKKKIVLRITTGLAAVSVMASLAACGGSKEEASEAGGLVMEKIDKTTGEPIADSAVSEEAGMDPNDENAAIQATLTYMGGLCVKDNPDSDMQFAMFRNEDGDLIGLVKEKDSFNYGIFTTESATLEDGKEYTKVDIFGTVYGYYFNDDLKSGVLINENGKVMDAVELDEDAARELVKITVTGE